MAMSDIDLQNTDIRALANRVNDTLSRRQGSADQWQLLVAHVAQPV